MVIKDDVIKLTPPPPAPLLNEIIRYFKLFFYRALVNEVMGFIVFSYVDRRLYVLLRERPPKNKNPEATYMYLDIKGPVANRW